MCSNVRAFYTLNSRSLWSLNMYIFIGLVIISCNTTNTVRSRPYSGNDTIANQELSSSTLIQVEDFFIEMLEHNGCTIRPKSSSAADMHNRIDLKLDDKRKLKGCKNIPRKGPRMKEWDGTNIPQQIDTCIVQTCKDLLESEFKDNAPNTQMSLYLPLIPIRK